jgi:hypothetical protein
MRNKPHTHWRPLHALLLVGLVLCLHLWLLSSTSLSWKAVATPESNTLRFETRQIAAEPAPAPTPERQLATANIKNPAPHLPAQISPQPLQELSPPAPAVTDTVSLPERSASAVDLPPFNRQAPDASASEKEITRFAVPAPALLKYDVNGVAKGFQYSAWGELLWKPTESSYEARLEIGAFLLGSRIQTSRGVLSNEGLMPERFGDKTRSELAAHFQRDKGIISFSANSPDAQLLKGAQDRLSIVLQLSALLAADPSRYPTGTVLSFQTVSQREAEVWQFAVDKEEFLDLPIGRLAAIKLNRAPRREFDQRVELWFAPQMGYLPVRIRITNANGDTVDQLLRSSEKPAP